MTRTVVVFKNSKGLEFDLRDFFSDRQVEDFTRCSLCLVVHKHHPRYFLADSLDMLPLFLGGKLYVREVLNPPVFRYLASIPKTDFGTVLTLQDRLEQIATIAETVIRRTISRDIERDCDVIRELTQDALAMFYEPLPEPESQPVKHKRILEI